ncbi:hypothetical protein DITRI_Ditri05aG0078600 [Diplodiscus trichospermus]
MLWLFSFLLSQQTRNQLLYLGLGFLTLGRAGQVALYPFLFLQFYLQKVGNNQVSGDIAEGRAGLWEKAAGFLGTFTCWAFASSLDWDHAFLVTFIVVTVAYLLFCCGCRYYEHDHPTENRAASRMIEAKRLLKLIPLCLTFIPYSLVNASGDTFFILQSDGLDQRINPRIAVGSFNRIPPTSLYVFRTIISSIMSISSNFLIGKFWSSENTMHHRRAGFLRIGIGMLFAFGSCLSAWLMEFGLLGIANGLIEEGMPYFFDDRLPQSMKFFRVPLTLCVLGIGRFVSAISILLAQGWIGNTIGEMHLDKYFLMLTILNITVLLVYIILSYMFDWNITDAHSETGTHLGEVDRRAGNWNITENITDAHSETGTPLGEVDGRAGD